MNLLNRMMSYDTNKIKNQESCNCEECVSKIKDDTFVKIKNTTFVNDILTKVENYQMMCKEKEFLTILNLRYWYKDKKTKTFIWKSLFVHGDKYIYHKTVYVKSSKNVEIECKNGHCFPQTPNHHLQGSGCRKCWLEFSSKKQRMTLSEFIERANKVHGKGRYDYSKVNYINNRTNVIIICHNHDEPYEFPQTPDNHLSGHGCSKCAKLLEDELRLTLEEFIERANKIHGFGRYDYSKVNYVNISTNVIIICNNHDIPYEFPQKPNCHLNGEGCPKCGGSKKLTTEEFIEKANKKHGLGRYDYSKVKYIDTNTEVIIICHNHDEPYEFPQTPNCHLNGHGCSLCNKKSKGESEISK